jgi:hypothetical protein
MIGLSKLRALADGAAKVRAELGARQMASV